MRLHELYAGLPDLMVVRLKEEIEQAISEQVCRIEPFPPNLAAVARYVEVASLKRSPNTCVIMWKRMPIVRVVRNGKRVTVQTVA